MKTTKPISTISFNTEPFLLQTLNTFVKAEKLIFWAYIRHEPESSEKKVHFHVFMIPATTLDTLKLKKEFAEFDISNPQKPLSCLNIEKSKFDDWYFYGMHDKVYLALKGKKKEIHYGRDEFVTSDSEQFNEYADNAIRGNEKTVIVLNAIQEAISDNMTFADVLSQGIIPVGSINQYKTAFESFLKQGRKDDRRHAAGQACAQACRNQ